MKELLFKELEKLQCAGAGLAVSNGKNNFYYAFGKAHLDYNIDINTQSVFNIASIGKLFTATLILKLVEEKKIALDTPVIHILNDLPIKWSAVTVQHLLTHSSGLPIYTSTTQYWKETRLDVSKERILDYVKEMDLRFEPGSKWEYNNTAFYLLGLLIEAIEKQDYFTVVQNKLFTPLGINTIYPTNHYSIIPNRVNGYSKTENGFKTAEYYSHSGTFSAGGFSADLKSYLVFEKALFEGNILNNISLQQLLAPFQFSNKESHQTIEFEMCHGPFLFNYNGKKVYAHGGGIVGFSSAYIRVLEDDIAMILAVNTQDIDTSTLHTILYKVYDVMRP